MGAIWKWEEQKKGLHIIFYSARKNTMAANVITSLKFISRHEI